MSLLLWNKATEFRWKAADLCKSKSALKLGIYLLSLNDLRKIKLCQKEATSGPLAESLKNLKNSKK